MIDWIGDVMIDWLTLKLAGYRSKPRKARVTDALASREHRPLGLASGTVHVVPYDPAWPALFNDEAARLAPVLSAHGVALRLEHTGSTAVSGLAAKPILDILAGWETEDARARAIRALESAGYVHRGEQGIPGRDFFRRGDPRQYHLHLTRVGSTFWNDHLTFRDHLRASPKAAQAYAALKLALAERYPTDRERYTDAKEEFVRGVLATARSASDKQ
jgi:GrpB-like predicted nucleotidyltransferase (UPF0157 family)